MIFYFIFFGGKKVLTQILGAGDIDALEQVEKCSHFSNTDLCTGPTAVQTYCTFNVCLLNVLKRDMYTTEMHN